MQRILHSIVVGSSRYSYHIVFFAWTIGVLCLKLYIFLLIAFIFSSASMQNVIMLWYVYVLNSEQYLFLRRVFKCSAWFHFLRCSWKRRLKLNNCFYKHEHVVVAVLFSFVAAFLSVNQSLPSKKYQGRVVSLSRESSFCRKQTFCACPVLLA